MKEKEFYKNKKILVTGSTGFKGSYLSLILHLFGAKVYGLGLAIEKNPDHIYELFHLNDKIKNYICDIRNSQALEQIIETVNPDIIFHLAAQPLVLKSYEDPMNSYETNIVGTLNLFETIRKNNNINTKTIINITTDKVYKNIEKNYFYKEDDKLGGHDPYSTSKACVELISESYRKSFFDKQDVNLITVRAGNIIGGGDFAKYRLIPDLIRACRNGEVLKIRNANAIRPWQHILDVCAGYLKLGQVVFQNHNKHFSYNISNKDKPITVKELLSNAILYLNKTIDIEYETINFHEAQLLQLDSSLIKNEFDFQNKFNNNEMIEETMNWYHIYLNKENVLDYTILQINKYFYE